MRPGRYTELFFLDEATALAAGHRPCAECQHDRFDQFREIWARANPKIAKVARPTAAALDAALHQERIATIARLRSFCKSVGDLPDGTFISDDEQTAYLVLGNQLLRWTPAGYERSARRGIRYPARVVTPGSVVRTLAAGYPVSIHPSAYA
jgi:methylphosphotriester-DNA--protein-cysteine methyltransferase